MNFSLNYCGVCKEFLGPDDFDGICPECDRKICDGCGEIMVADGESEDGDEKYRCPFCDPATEGEKRLNSALDAAHDEIEKLHQRLADANAKLTAVPVKEIRSAYLSAYYDGSDVLEVRDWLIEQGVELP